MLRSMYAGISGMKNFQTKLDAIGNNIANVNTYGYKKERVTFKDAMNQMISGASAAQNGRGGTNPMQIGLGSSLGSIDTIDTAGSMQTTGRALDLAISGDGYFIVKQGDQQFYTRAGNFYLDNNGTLVNADGLKVQAYSVENGTVSNNYGDINVNVNGVLPSVSTGNLQFSGNLSADSNVGTVYSQQIETIDQNGNPQSSTIYFKKLDSTNWGVYINNQPNTPSVGAVTADSSTNVTGDIVITNPQDYTGPEDGSTHKWTINYVDNPVSPNSHYEIDKGDGNGSVAIPEDEIVNNKFTQDGLQIDLSNLTLPSSGTPAGTWSFTVNSATKPDYTLGFDANGKILSTNAQMDGQRIAIPSGKVDDTSTAATDESKLLASLDFSNLTQQSGPSTAQVTPDGYQEGSLESFSVGSNGEIDGVYSNGLIKVLGQLALAKFSNASGLNRAGGNLFQATINSGTPDINIPGVGRGTIAAGTLEMSNVDLSEEFTDMITAQRGFQANTKIITTSDEILQELLNLKR